VSRAAAALLPLLLAPALPAQQPGEPEPIQDNSFLIEEAYNQESGVVQHISAFSRADGGDLWTYTFTQEWPLGGTRHQLSYTVPLQHGPEPGGTGLGDLALNYRHQLVPGGDADVHLAPRLTLLMPTGSEEEGRGAGGVGLQANLPASLMLHRRLAAHLNAGLTVTPSAQDPLGAEVTTTSGNLGASLVWLAGPKLNLLLEALWLSTESVAGPGETAREESVFLNPGVRWAHNFDSGLQIVPGLAYTIGVGPSSGDDALFLYLSLEHPFRKAAAGR
jgi:hypothetical protein